MNTLQPLQQKVQGKIHWSTVVHQGQNRIAEESKSN